MSHPESNRKGRIFPMHLISTYTLFRPPNPPLLTPAFRSAIILLRNLCSIILSVCLSPILLSSGQSLFQWPSFLQLGHGPGGAPATPRLVFVTLHTLLVCPMASQLPQQDCGQLAI